MTGWDWEYRPGELVEKTLHSGATISEPQPTAPHWRWLGETPTEQAQVLGARRARVDRS